MTAVSLRVHVRLPNVHHVADSIVEPATFDELRSLVPADRWELMLTPATEEYPEYRAWLRAKHEGQVPTRLMGRPAATADQAVRLLADKVRPLARTR